MNHFNQLLQEYFGTLSSQELEILSSCFKEEKLEKGQYFTEADKTCNRLSLVKSGFLRVYALADGKEITQWISSKNTLITEVTGFFFNEPNRWTIQAFTDCELLTLSKTQYTKLCTEYPKWNQIEKTFILKCFASIEERIFSHLSLNAEERYKLYFEQNKALFNQIPLHYIASILGMTPETFSRIRNRNSSLS